MISLLNNEIRELLTIFMEESAECIVEASKIIRFGFGENSHRLEKEIGDLMCMIELLEDYSLIDQEGLEEAIKEKKKKLKTWTNLTKL